MSIFLHVFDISEYNLKEIIVSALFSFSLFFIIITYTDKIPLAIHFIIIYNISRVTHHTYYIIWKGQRKKWNGKQ